jgi:hypothetical protein
LQQVHQFDKQLFSSIVYWGSLFMMLGESGIFTSADGAIWNQQTSAGGGWLRLRVGLNRVLALGQDIGVNGASFPKLGISSNGLTWATQRLDNVSSPLSYPWDAATDGQSLVLIGNRDCEYGGSVWRWVEGSPWAEVYRDLPRSVPTFVAFGNGRYLISQAPYNTNGPAVLISDDGVSWTKHAPLLEDGVGDSLFDGIGDLIFAYGNFYATDVAYGTPEVLSSPDGVRWKAHPTGFQRSLNGLSLTAGPQGLFALGSEALGSEVFYSPWGLLLTARKGGFSRSFLMDVTGPSGARIRVQRAVALNGWSDWQTIMLRDGPAQVEDTDIEGLSNRFYRAILSP